MKKLNLYLVRHGQTEWNIANRMQGSKDSPLTEKGILGAKITGQHLKNVPFIQAYSSHLPRAVQTRDYILAENNHEQPSTFELSELSEMDFGKWEGVHVPTLKETEPDFHVYMSNPSAFTGLTNQGETYLDLLNRMQRGVKEIVQNANQNTGNILIVSHGTALRLLLCVLNQGDWHLHRDENYFAPILNTSISLVTYQQNDTNSEGHFEVNFLNNIDHLLAK